MCLFLARKKKEEEKEDFDLDTALLPYPYLAVGFKKWIKENGIEIKSKDDFDKIFMNDYGG